MNQPFLINTNSISSPKVAVNASSANASKTEGIQARSDFADALDKQIEKPTTAANKAEKQTQTENKKEKIDAVDEKQDGKKLPEAKEKDAVSTAETNEKSQAHKADDSDNETSADTVTFPEKITLISLNENKHTEVGVKEEQNAEIESNEKVSEPLELSVELTEEVDDSSEVSDEVAFEETVSGELTTPQLVQQTITEFKGVIANKQAMPETDVSAKAKEIGKQITDAIKQTTQQVNQAQQEQTQVTSEDAVTEQADIAVGTDKQTTKLRPDIMQALSLRAGGQGKEQNQTTATGLNSMKVAEGITIKNTDIVSSQVSEVMDKVVTKLAQNSNSAMTDTKLPAAFNSVLNNQVSSTSAVKAEVPVLDIQPSIQNSAWSRVMTSRVIWMAKERVQEASLKLNPAQLGQVEVKLNMQNDQANVSFVTQTAATRDALEQAIPRLRESFAQNGLELTNADVSQQSFGQSGESKDEADLGANSGSSDNGISQSADNNNEETVVQDEQDVDLGLSIYA
jgi:flagellar hook-length control protein FliK